LGLFVFNILVVIGLFAFFVWNAKVLASAYRDSQTNPPSSLATVYMGDSLLLPSVVVCNELSSPLNLVYASAGNNPCEAVQFQDQGTNKSCIFVNRCFSPLAFEQESGISNSIEILVDVNVALATEDDFGVGVNVQLRNSEFSSSKVPKSQTSIPDGWAYAGAGSYTSISLTLTEYNMYQTDIFYDLNVFSGSMPLNQLAYENTSSLVLLDIDYFSPMVRKISSEPQSFSVFFGSLAGWMGACSSGWGALTVIFFIEKFLLRCTGHAKEQLWYVKADEQYKAELDLGL
jgi:hypothetical protein